MTDDFHSVLAKHGGIHYSPAALYKLAGRLLALAEFHRTKLTVACNTGDDADVGSVETELRRMAINDLGCSDVLFSHDPRGCTVRLVFPDGFNNDLEGVGYCVPQG